MSKESVTLRPSEILTASSAECRHKKRQIELSNNNQPQVENTPCQRCLSRGRGRGYWERVKGLTRKTAQPRGLEGIARRSQIIGFERGHILTKRPPRLARAA